MLYQFPVSFFCALLLSVFNVEGQNIDSLLRELSNHKKEDIERLQLLNTVSKELEYSNPKRGVETADSAIALAGKLGNQREAAYAYMRKGENYNSIGGLNNEALKNFKTALDYFEKTDSKREIASCLHGLGSLYSDIADYPQALTYYQQALTINKEINNKQGMGINLGNIGFVYYRLSEYSKVLDYRQQALKIQEETGDMKSVATQLGGIGQAYAGMGDYPKALEYFQRSARVDDQLSNKTGTSRTLGEIGNLYTQMGNFPLALEYLQKAKTIQEEIGNKRAIAIANQNIGSLYSRQGRYSAALPYLQTALDMAEQLNEYGLQASCLGSIGVVYHFLENYSEALIYYKSSLALDEKLQVKGHALLNINNIGEVYRDAPDSVLMMENVDPRERYDKALEYFQKAFALAVDIKAATSQRDIMRNIYITYEKHDNYTKALKAYKQFISLRDSITNNAKDKKIARLVLQNEFDKKEDSVKLQIQLSNAKLKEEKLIAKQQLQELQLNKKELLLTNQEKDLQKLAYLKTQSDLQNEQLQGREKEKQLTLSEKEKQLQLANVKTLTQEKHLNTLKQQQQWLYIVGGLALLGLGSIYLIHRTRLKEVRLRNEIAAEKIEKQQKEAEFQRKLGDISLSALRSQMNPHFIFNCLNSIKLYTTQNDTTAATEYLSKFSKLIRLVMENSRNDRITLRSELDALQLYIEMEVMRFKEKLAYTINVNDNVETDYIEIPPLLLQPYVENAIWHGLMHKEAGGRIDINVSMQKNESLLEISIVDNGIGRARSAELRSKTATKHKSYGMKVTSERIALINQIYRTGANVAIHDLIDAEGQPGGTEVTIQIPV